MNKSDSERIASYLEAIGYKRAEKRSAADLVVFNTCGVRQSAENRFYGLLRSVKKENPDSKIIVSGCLSQRPDIKKKRLPLVDMWLPIHELPKLSEKLGKSPAGHYDDYLKIRPCYSSSFSAFVPIGNGCDNFCAYCVVPHARGREIYRDYREIYKECRGLLEKGYKEIILIAQNVNSYRYPHKGRPAGYLKDIHTRQDKKIDFSGLISLISGLKGDFWLRFATSHPKDMDAGLIRAISGSKTICRHIHLPAQSGDNKILSLMNRGYTREEYLALIADIKEKLDKNDNTAMNWQPPVSLTTDIIVGFPGETKKQFLNTKKLFREAGFDMAYIARYSPRPGTRAEKMPDNVPEEEKKAREKELMALLRKIALKNNSKYLSRKVKVLVERHGRRGGLFGRTSTAKAVKVSPGIKDPESLIGNFIEVIITEAEDFGFKGVIAGD